MNIQDLNSQFGITDQLNFAEGSGGLPMIEIKTDHASARISLHAGQVLSYKPAHIAEDLMFLSEKAYYQDGKAIKGGAPICWPWFGPDPEGKGRPGHGFVRNRPWNVLKTETVTNGDIKITLGLENTEETQAIWPHSFILRQEITVGQSLNLALITQNTGTEAFIITQAFHTYLKVGNINQASVSGLEQCQYIDKVDDSKQKQQKGAVAIEAEVDRIYLDVPNTLVIDDPALKRKIQIQSSGNKTAVVWNPWAKISADMADLEDNDYQRLLCVETTNAADDVITIAPNSTYQLTANYSVA